MVEGLNNYKKFIIPTQTNIGYVQNPIANQQQTTVQQIITQPSIERGNLLTNSLDDLANRNKNCLQQNQITKTPSGIEDYNNLVETDKMGNVITKISYEKNDDVVIQNVNIKSPDGTSLDKVTSNSPAKQETKIIIKNKNGEEILTKTKSYEKIDNDKAKTIVDGKVYNISGLSSDVITVEQDGKVTQIDLNKLLSDVVEKFPTKQDNSWERKEKITDEEKETLFKQIKSLNGDDLVRLSKSVNVIQCFDDEEDSFYKPDNKRLLLSGKIGHGTILHELGHAVNNENNQLLSDNQNFINYRNYEKKYFILNKSNSHTDNWVNGKFFDTEGCMKALQLNTDNAECRLRDETFAEIYEILNETEILDYDNGASRRTLPLMKYLPQTTVQVEKLLNN